MQLSNFLFFFIVILVSCTNSTRKIKYKNLEYYVNTNDSLIKNGDFIEYYSNHKPAIKCQFVNNKLTGKFIGFHNETNSLAIESHYFEGKLDGVYIEYYESKNNKKKEIFRKIYFNKGVGLGDSYNRNGTLISRAQYMTIPFDYYEIVVPDGYYIEFFKNGNYSKIGHYKKSHPTGVWMYFYENGSIESISRSENGYTSGLKIDFLDTTNNIFTLGNYKYSNKEGKWYFFSNYELKKIDVYKSDSLIKRLLN